MYSVRLVPSPRAAKACPLPFSWCIVFAARWRSEYATVCKAVDPGSIPGLASRPSPAEYCCDARPHTRGRGWPYVAYKTELQRPQQKITQANLGNTGTLS